MSVEAHIVCVVKLPHLHSEQLADTLLVHHSDGLHWKHAASHRHSWEFGEYFNGLRNKLQLKVDSTYQAPKIWKNTSKLVVF